MQHLLDDQYSAIEKLKKYRVGALFMEPGTGKTRTAYELIKSVSNVDYILWLTPYQTKDNLKIEIDKCGGFDNLEIQGIESLSSSDRLYLDLVNKLEKAENPFVVCDESLKIKNYEAKRTQRIIKLGTLSEYKLILNGTPITKNLLDLWAQMEFLSPKILNMGITEYKNTFCEWVKITKSIGRHSVTNEFITGYHNVDHLYSLIKHYIYEADLKLEVKQNFVNLDYQIDYDMKHRYAEIKEQFLNIEKLTILNNNIFLEMTQKLQHAYCCSSNKFDLVEKLSEENIRILIYCKYIKSANECKKRFPSATILTYGKHSYGLNLQEYPATIYFDKTFDFAQRKQAGYRTYRVGQSKDCQYYDLTGDVGLESLINKNIRTKTDLLQYFKTKTIDEIRKEL